MTATPETISMIREMRARGVPVQVIAQITGLTRQCVSAYSYQYLSTSDIMGMPAWRLQGWEIRAIEIKEKRYEKHKHNFVLA